MGDQYKTQEQQEQEFLQNHSEAVLYSQGEGKEAKVTYAKGIRGPGIMVFFSDTAEGYKLDIRSCDEGPLSACIGQLEILLDRELKNPIVKNNQV